MSIQFHINLIFFQMDHTFVYFMMPPAFFPLYGRLVYTT